MANAQTIQLSNSFGTFSFNPGNKLEEEMHFDSVRLEEETVQSNGEIDLVNSLRKEAENSTHNKLVYLEPYVRRLTQEYSMKKSLYTNEWNVIIFSQPESMFPPNTEATHFFINSVLSFSIKNKSFYLLMSLIWAGASIGFFFLMPQFYFFSYICAGFSLLCFTLSTLWLLNKYVNKYLF